MKPQFEDYIFICGFIVCVVMVIFHYDATVVAGLTLGHKGISTVDGKFPERHSNEN